MNDFNIHTHFVLLLTHFVTPWCVSRRIFQKTLAQLLLYPHVLRGITTQWELFLKSLAYRNAFMPKFRSPQICSLNQLHYYIMKSKEIFILSDGMLKTRNVCWYTQSVDLKAFRTIINSSGNLRYSVLKFRSGLRGVKCLTYKKN